jgi:hypothetical protein
MTMLNEIAAELIGMFVGDAQLAVAILAIIAGAAALVELTTLPPLVSGATLLFGCLLLLIENVRRSARAAQRR